ncbi:hypothetical protein JKP88DRAFT_253510 [Tribonema minus]|uniref:Uncharacterized protein n=1 Tax=Tribonema minus TaxID=303371 RepID=A0A836CK95_9STRA|nr:hypothetical protein JKP88DRAFT_253510 [Tribonema minus]
MAAVSPTGQAEARCSGQPSLALLLWEAVRAHGAGSTGTSAGHLTCLLAPTCCVANVLRCASAEAAGAARGAREAGRSALSVMQQHCLATLRQSKEPDTLRGTCGSSCRRRFADTAASAAAAAAAVAAVADVEALSGTAGAPRCCRLHQSASIAKPQRKRR